MRPTILLLILSCAVFCAAQTPKKSTVSELMALANGKSPALPQAIATTFEEKDLKEGTAWLGHGPDFFFATAAASKPELIIDGHPGPKMKMLPHTTTWYTEAHIGAVGELHSFHYMVNGARFGGRLDLPAFTPNSYLQPGVPSGTLSEKIVHTSKIYDGMKADYWIYVPAQYDAKTPAALMVFQDGGWYIDRTGNNLSLNVIDNLIAQKKIPVMICVFINPGDISGFAGNADLQFC